MTGIAPPSTVPLSAFRSVCDELGALRGATSPESAPQQWTNPPPLSHSPDSHKTSPWLSDPNGVPGRPEQLGEEP